MTTFDFKIQEDFTEFLREYNTMKRCAFNLIKKSEVELKRDEVVRKLESEYNYNKELLDFTLLRWIVEDAQASFDSREELGLKTTTFGSKKSWQDFNAGKITKEEFLAKKNGAAMLLIGDKTATCGNRKAVLDIENQQVVLKPRRGVRHVIKLLTSPSDKRLKELKKAQASAEAGEIPLTYRISNSVCAITFDESCLREEELVTKERRIAALDLNPEFIALVIQDFRDEDAPVTVYKEVFQLTGLLPQSANKNKNEIYEIAKRVAELCKHYKVECVGVEQLKMPKSRGVKRHLNKKLNNDWRRKRFVENLRKRLNIIGIACAKISAAYSSTIGCANHPEETDSVAAALEIARRTFLYNECFFKHNPNFQGRDVVFPRFCAEVLKERWNSILGLPSGAWRGWKEFHNALKEQKKSKRLRLLFEQHNFADWSCFSLLSRKTYVFQWSK